MNPSNVGTNVRKKIDDWHFLFTGKVVVVQVFILRPRDAQSDEDTEPGKITFRAMSSGAQLLKAGIKPKKFADIFYEDADINALRERCEKHCADMLRLEWKHIIVIGFQSEVVAVDDFSHGPLLKLEFDYASGYTSGEYCRREIDSDTERRYWLREPSELLAHSCGFPKDAVHVYDYSEELLEGLRVLKERYQSLNVEVSKLLTPAGIGQLTTLNVGPLLMCGYER